MAISLIACAIALTTALCGCRRSTDHDWSPDGAIVSNPLTHAGDGQGKLFQLLPAEKTGIDYQITWNKPQKYDRIFYAQNTGGGVAIGDYDDDGRPDIFFTGPDGCRLYRNLGEFAFDDVTQRVLPSSENHWGTSATWADIDNDGDLDLYVCGYDTSNKLYFNHGDGQFREAAESCGLAFHGASVMMAFADYDCDGDLDAYLLTAGIQPGPEQKFRVKFVGDRPVIPDDLKEFWQLAYLPGDHAKQLEAAQYDHFYRNDGPGKNGAVRFTEVTEQAGITGPDFGQAAVWWDYNDDGWPDLYVANDYWGPDYLYRNNGDGTFTDVKKDALPHTPWSSMGADFADINGDGRLDFMATDMSGSSHYKQKLGMGDMSSSGWFLEYAIPRQYMRNALYLNSATERFQEAAYLTGIADTDWTWSPRFEDFDNDGRVDLFVTNGMTRDFTNSDLNERAKATHGEGTAEFFKFWLRQDMRKDRNLAYRNLGDLRFENVSGDWGLDRLGVSFGAATGDLDGDGDLDLVVNNMDRPAGVYENRTGGRRVTIRLEGTRSNRGGIGAAVQLVAGDSQQVRYHAPVRGWSSCNEPIVHFGLGDVSEITQLTVRWPSGLVQTFENLATDHAYTITEPYSDPPKLAGPRSDSRKSMFSRSEALTGVRHRETPYDDFARQPLLPNKLSQLGPSLAWSDVNGDGQDDVYLGQAAGASGILLIGQASGTFEKTSNSDLAQHASYEDMGALFFEADGDGDLDLHVASANVESPGADRLYLNDGRGRFVLAAADALGHSGDSNGVVCAADYDRDGDLDLFVGGRCVPGKYPLAPRSRLLRNDGGKFVSMAVAVAPDLVMRGMVTSALWSDADDDGWLDLLVTYEWGPVRLFHNESGRQLVDVTESAGLAQRLGWWNGIAGRDLDHDGDIDYVVTNFGLNTKYHASTNKPVRIYYGDFDGSGRERIVEAAVKDEGLLPIRGKSCSQNAIPVLRARFPTYHEFASSLLSDIYTDACLERCQVFEVNTLETGVLFNDGKGHFEFQPLPRLAQIAPSFGVALEDVDADGHPDIYLVQNFYSPQRETGRMDGGVSLLLRGDGKGGFTPVWPNESGLLVPGDGKSLTVTDLNGDHHPDFVIGVNDGEVLAFENQAEGKHLAVRLKGKRGNPTGVGARVTLHLSNGETQTAEVQAGGGYLSQSTPTLFFGLGDAEAERIEVRWPDGIATAHSIEASDLVTIDQQCAVTGERR